MIAAAVVGLLAGSIPSADWIARIAGHDLRSAGTGNPGTKNALALGGPVLGTAVLVVEMVKGAGAVTVGRLIGDDGGGAVAAVGAIAGNVYNPWFGLRGGKGLAIAGGTVAAAWPPVLPVLAVILGGATGALKRSGPAALIAFVAWVVAAIAATRTPIPTGWGLDSPGWRLAAAVGSVVVMAPKHVADTVTPDDRHASPG